MFNAMSGASVVDCEFVIGGRKLFELGIEFSVEWCSDTVLRVAFAQIVYFQENNCIANFIEYTYQCSIYIHNL
jgi:hypothetical protein